MAVIALLLQAGAVALASPPRPITDRARPIIGYKDYPEDALRSRQVGIVTVLLQIDERGRATSCAVTETSDSSSLDAVTCNMMKRRGRFEAAKAADGRPIAAEYRTVVSWGLEGRFPKTSFDFALPVARIPAGYVRPMKAQAEFDETGRAVACTPTESSGSESADRAMCSQISGRLRVEPPKSRSAEPARAVRLITVALRAGASGGK